MANPQVGEVQPQSYQSSSEIGYGFVMYDGDTPICTITFESIEEATRARRTIGEWMSKAVEIVRC